MDEVLEKGDDILFQDKDGKEWNFGTVSECKANEVVVKTETGEKRVHPSRVKKYCKDIDTEDSDRHDNVVTNEDRADDERRLTRSMKRVKFEDEDDKRVIMYVKQHLNQYQISNQIKSNQNQQHLNQYQI